MTWVGDFALESTFDVKFTTVNTSGAPTTLAGTPVVSAYVGNSVTQITAGITLTVDFDAVTGLHNVRVVATAANGYATASNYQLVITTGTVGGTSVVGYVVAQFSIEARSALRPTVAARTLDVSATGEAGLDWANIGSPTTAQNLSATNIDVDQVVASVSGAVGSVTGAVGSVTGNVGGNVVGSVASVTAAVTVGTNNDKTGYALTATTGLGNQTASITGNLSGSVGSVTGAVGSVTAAVTVGTNNDKTGYALTAGERTSVADALLDRDMSTGTDSGSATVRTVRQALRFLRNKWSIAAGTLTVTKEDDTTASWTAVVTTAASNPVDSVDPASV